mmetsp:Transcript_124148/g.397066  ORF Transcript_124148/g.397066 Transcript_124148/m.397066 type:complete len:331 (-) Transcript_124148:380-1372(-)
MGSSSSAQFGGGPWPRALVSGGGHSAATYTVAVPRTMKLTDLRPSLLGSDQGQRSSVSSTRKSGRSTKCWCESFLVSSSNQARVPLAARTVTKSPYSCCRCRRSMPLQSTPPVPRHWRRGLQPLGVAALSPGKSKRTSKGGGNESWNCMSGPGVHVTFVAADGCLSKRAFNWLMEKSLPIVGTSLVIGFFPFIPHSTVGRTCEMLCTSRSRAPTQPTFDSSIAANSMRPRWCSWLTFSAKLRPPRRPKTSSLGWVTRCFCSNLCREEIDTLSWYCSANHTAKNSREIDQTAKTAHNSCTKTGACTRSLGLPSINTVKQTPSIKLPINSCV